jgi:hypothetical protein
MTQAAKSRAKKERRTPLGRRVVHLVRGEGKSPARDTIAWLEQTGTDDVQTLCRALRQAMVQRSHDGTHVFDAPVRDLESPHARLVLAVWLCVAEMTRHGMANSRALWLGHDRTGLGGGIAGRLGVCRYTVGRMLSALQHAGALKRWRGPKDSIGLVKGHEHGRPYNSYFIRVVPKNLAHQVRTYWVRQKRETELPEPTEAPVRPAAPEPLEAPPEPAHGPSVVPLTPADHAALAELHEELAPFARAAAYDRQQALATYGAFFPSGPPGKA